MLAAFAERTDPHHPLDALVIADRPEPRPHPGWATVRVRAAGINHHDLWTLRGLGITTDQLPVILGSDGAGLDESGNEVIIYPVIGVGSGYLDDETLDPHFLMLSTDYDGTFAQSVMVPAANLIPKPAELSFAEAACLPGSWLTAFRMLTEKAGLTAPATVLVQGAAGGVSSALVVLARAFGHRVWVTSRSEAKREWIRKIGADEAYPAGARLPERVDVVFETVGAVTWSHSINAVRPGGRIVIAGATSGGEAETNLRRIFFRQISICGSVLGTREQLSQLARFCVSEGIRPIIQMNLPLSEARDGLAVMESGNVFGKIVLRP